jgi:predicted glycogen debranching enzyme
MDRPRRRPVAPLGGGDAGTLDWGREICGDLEVAERREWLCTNGLGGFASGTIAGSLTRRYHGLLVAALAPPLGRTLVVAKLEEDVAYAGGVWALGTNRWADGTVAPHGFREIERFRLDGTTPVWSYACGDALLDKRVWMEPGANTTYVRYEVRRVVGPLVLSLRALVNHRDYHATTQAGGWRLRVVPVEHGLRVEAFDGAVPVWLLAPGGEREVAHAWYRRFALPRERERGLDGDDDHLHAGTIRTTLRAGEALTVVLSTEAAASTDGASAWRRRQDHEADLLARWTRTWPGATLAPAWIRHLVFAADQFVARRPLADEPDGRTIIAGYPWFGDWGRDTMLALPGLALATGRPELAVRVLRTFARFLDRGMLPNRFPDGGETPEYNTVDATLWWVEAIRATHAATGDDGLLEDMWPALESVVDWHRRGTRYGIGEDPADGLLRAGEPGVQLTWMDAKVGDWVVTPRIGKPIEVNALWYNALRTLAGFARRLRRPADPWDAAADRVRHGFARFWSERHDHCFDVLDGPAGNDAALRPNQLLAVSLTESPLGAEQQRRVVQTCARHLLTSLGLRSLAAGDPAYCGSCSGDQRRRDGAYHQGTVWSWLLGPFAIAHARVHGDPRAARAFLEPMAHHLADYGVGSIAEIFDGDAPFVPRGCIAQAWSVAETLRAWQTLTDAATAGETSRRRRRARRG